MIAAIAVTFQYGKSILRVAASMMMSDVEAVTNAKVTKLAEHIMIRQPAGAIATTGDHKFSEGFQKVVSRDKEVDLVVGLAG